METEIGERLKRLWEKVLGSEGEMWVVVLGTMGKEIVDAVKEGGKE